MLRCALLASLLFACTPSRVATRAPVIDVRGASAPPVAVMASTEPETGPARLPDDPSRSPGCFAWSRSRRKVACIVGDWGMNMGETTEPSLVKIGPADAEGPELEESLLDDDAARARASAELVEGGFVMLPAARRLAADSLSTIGGFSIRARHARVDDGGENAAPRYDVSLVVQHGRKKPSIVHDLPSVACEEPFIDVRELAGVGLLIEHVCHVADEGVYGVHASAWVCSGTDCR